METYATQIQRLRDAFDEVRNHPESLSESTQLILTNVSRRSPAYVLKALDRAIFLSTTASFQNNLGQYSWLAALDELIKRQRDISLSTEKGKAFWDQELEQNVGTRESLCRRFDQYVNDLRAKGSTSRNTAERDLETVRENPLPQKWEEASLPQVNAMLLSLVLKDAENIIRGGAWFLDKMHYISQTIVPLFKSANPEDPAIAGWERDIDTCENNGRAHLEIAERSILIEANWRANFLDRAQKAEISLDMH